MSFQSSLQARVLAGLVVILAAIGVGTVFSIYQVRETIAAQAAAANTITRSVVDTAHSTRAVRQRIATVMDTVRQVDGASQFVTARAGDLTTQAANLNKRLRSFLELIRLS